MFFTLSDRSHVFERKELSRLISVVPLCAQTLIIFCDDLTFYHYSLVDRKILYESKLPGRVRSAISISAHEILCTVLETRSLILVNTYQKLLDEICRIPQTKMHNDNKEKEILSQTTLHRFEASNSFYICQPNNEDNKIKIYFHTKSEKGDSRLKAESFTSKTFNTKKLVLKKLDSYSKLVVFRQEIQNNGQFKFVTVDCAKNFEQKQIACEHKAFTRQAIVKEVRSISKPQEIERMLVFVNCNGPEILVVTQGDVQNYLYKNNKIFLSTILVNVELGYGMFMFLPDPEETDPKYTTAVELVCLETGVVQDSKKCDVYEVVKSFQDDYLLYFRPENKIKNVSEFKTDHIICKKAHYMKTLQQLGFGDLSSELMGMIMHQLQS